eukprot:9404924-Heterocapsa_arctica.AAC.1
MGVVMAFVRTTHTTVAISLLSPMISSPLTMVDSGRCSLLWAIQAQQEPAMQLCLVHPELH